MENGFNEAQKSARHFLGYCRNEQQGKEKKEKSFKALHFRPISSISGFSY
jgi:hypothetical protein